jgi:hypothetical protein
MACPNFKNGPKNGLGPLRVNRKTEQLNFGLNIQITELGGESGDTLSQQGL